MERFIDKRLEKISEELSDSKEKQLHARIEIDNRDELLKEAGLLIEKLIEKKSCECSPPCRIDELTWSTCSQYRDCLQSNDCLPCLYCESVYILEQIEVVANTYGNWFDDPIASVLSRQLRESLKNCEDDNSNVNIGDKDANGRDMDGSDGKKDE